MLRPINRLRPLSTVITNGVGANTLLLGNQINPASAVAQKMTDTLHAELEAHSIYRDEEKINVGLIGPALPGKRETSTPGAVLNSTQPPPLPQSLEQLLERQWEQGSQFLMEQAQHFDIASLLSCLHQLRQENVRLEETVNNLIARRDHLLAVNARLSVPLSSSQATTQPSSSSSTAAAAAASSTSLACSTGLSLATSASTASLIPITPAVPPSVATSLIGGQLQISSHVGSVSSSTILASTRGPISQQQQRHPSGGSSHSGLGNPPSRVSGERGASPHDRRNHHQGQPLENGLPESEYRYRSPGSDHHSRQQSPMLPPGAQPSPTSLRQSPASSSYHSGSPHTGVPSLSPSGVSHPPPSQHTLVTHVPSSHAVHHGGSFFIVFVSWVSWRRDCSTPRCGVKSIRGRSSKRS
ncbi:hypothetical protein Anas_02220 [Armadillidium nasatum]|uniref:Uncharacterized protein n=1 Tax=Armadillidium nasatum TaxID=96803 RepID=A0A5N5TBH5_9CRUS|nr:hypothetical protein Anas_02220 [Armadillidium nasatum]